MLAIFWLVLRHCELFAKFKSSENIDFEILLEILKVTQHLKGVFVLLKLEKDSMWLFKTLRL